MIPRWSRILNLVIFPVLRPRVQRVADVAALSPTLRGTGGLGSTGG